MLQNAVSALVQDDVSSTTNEIKKEFFVKVLFISLHTEPPGVSTIPELDINHPKKDLKITEQLVKEQLNSLNTSKSPELDKIHP